MSHVDWEKIRAEYLAGGTSYRRLADKHGVSFSTLEKRARAENWSDQRRDVSEAAATKARQKIVSQRARDIELLDRSRSLLIRRLCASIEKYPDMPGNRMEQSIHESIPDGKDGKGRSKQKVVRFEADLLKMVHALDKLMIMTGFNGADEQGTDDGFIDALNACAAEVTADDEDVPEGI